MRACEWCDKGEHHPFARILWLGFCIKGDLSEGLRRRAELLMLFKETMASADNPAVMMYQGTVMHCWPDSTYEDIEQDFFQRRPLFTGGEG
jgi:hypothetical protein